MKILLINRFEEATQVELSSLDLELMTGRLLSNMDSVLEALFALSNDPIYAEDRDLLWGNNRSLSVGDIVILFGNVYEVASTGFNLIHQEAK